VVDVVDVENQHPPSTSTTLIRWENKAEMKKWWMWWIFLATPSSL